MGPGPVPERPIHDESALSRRRAANSVALDLGEAAYHNAGHRRLRFESTRGQLLVRFELESHGEDARGDALTRAVIEQVHRWSKRSRGDGLDGET